MESQAFLACPVLMAKEVYPANQGRGARWVGRGFLVTLGREDHLGQMESQVTWEPPVQTEFLDLLETWDLWDRLARQDLMD